MHKAVTKPPVSKRLTDMETDLNKWEYDLAEYIRCGGEPMAEMTKVRTAKDMLPTDTNASVHLSLKDVITYDAFRDTLRATVQYLVDHGAIRAAPVNVIEAYDVEDPTETQALGANGRVCPAQRNSQKAPSPARPRARTTRW